MWRKSHINGGDESIVSPQRLQIKATSASALAKTPFVSRRIFLRSSICENGVHPYVFLFVCDFVWRWMVKITQLITDKCNSWGLWEMWSRHETQTTNLAAQLFKITSHYTTDSLPCGRRTKLTGDFQEHSTVPEKVDVTQTQKLSSSPIWRSESGAPACCQ